MADSNAAKTSVEAFLLLLVCLVPCASVRDANREAAKALVPCFEVVPNGSPEDSNSALQPDATVSNSSGIGS